MPGGGSERLVISAIAGGVIAVLLLAVMVLYMHKRCRNEATSHIEGNMKTSPAVA